MEQTPSYGKVLSNFILLLVISGLFLLCGRFVPVLGNFVMFIWAIPVVLAVFRCGFPLAMVLASLIVMTGFAVFGLFDGVSILGNMAVIGLFYGVRMKEKASPGMTLFGGIFLAVIFEILFLLVVWKIGGVSMADMRASFESYMNEVYGLYANAGLADAALAENMSVSAYIKTTAATMADLLPSFNFIAAMAIAFTNYLFAQSWLKKKNAGILSLPPFRQWHLPWWLLWSMVLALALLVAGNFFDYPLAVVVAKNIVVCFVPVFMIAGISLLRFYFTEWRMSSGIQVFLWIMMVLFLSFSLIFFVLMGAADTALNYRELRKKKMKNNDGGHEI